MGLDIGGSNVRLVLADRELNIVGNVYRTQFKKFNTVEEEVEENICSLIETTLKDKRIDEKSIKAIGLSLAALFDRESGCITFWPNNSMWNGFPLREYLQKKFNIPFLFEDDANSAAIGELCYGSAKGYNSFAYITVSTGIGCGLVLNGDLYTGTHGWAGEIGHIKLQESTVKCKCGATGCLQALVSGPALLSRAEELAAHYDSRFSNKIEDLTQVAAYAQAGEGWALRVFDEAGEYLANALNNMIMLLDVPLIVIGGGVALAGDILISPIAKTLKSSLGCRRREVIVEAAKCGNECGVFGIVALARNMIKNNRKLHENTAIWRLSTDEQKTR